jgi:hypothetical protein
VVPVWLQAWPRQQVLPRRRALPVLEQVRPGVLEAELVLVSFQPRPLRERPGRSEERVRADLREERQPARQVRPADRFGRGQLVSRLFPASGGAGVTAAFGIEAGGGEASGADVAAVAASVTGAAMGVEPVTDLARAAGVLTPARVDAMAAAPDVAVFAALGAGAPAVGFFGAAGLNESRIFSAAAASCARMCGICSNTVSAGRRSFIMRGMTCWRNNP